MYTHVVFFITLNCGKKKSCAKSNPKHSEQHPLLGLVKEYQLFENQPMISCEFIYTTPKVS